MSIGSDVIRFPMAGATVIFVNSWSAAVELMEKRSSIYSDRCLPTLFSKYFNAQVPTQTSGWNGHDERAVRELLLVVSGALLNEMF